MQPPKQPCYPNEVVRCASTLHRADVRWEAYGDNPLLAAGLSHQAQLASLAPPKTVVQYEPYVPPPVARPMPITLKLPLRMFAL